MLLLLLVEMLVQGVLFRHSSHHNSNEYYSDISSNVTTSSCRFLGRDVAALISRRGIDGNWTLTSVTCARVTSTATRVVHVEIPIQITSPVVIADDCASLLSFANLRRSIIHRKVTAKCHPSTLDGIYSYHSLFKIVARIYAGVPVTATTVNDTCAISTRDGTISASLTTTNIMTIADFEPFVISTLNNFTNNLTRWCKAFSSTYYLDLATIAVTQADAFSVARSGVRKLTGLPICYLSGPGRNSIVFEKSDEAWRLAVVHCGVATLRLPTGHAHLRDLESRFNGECSSLRANLQSGISFNKVCRLAAMSNAVYALDGWLREIQVLRQVSRLYLDRRVTRSQGSLAWMTKDILRMYPDSLLLEEPDLRRCHLQVLSGEASDFTGVTIEKVPGLTGCFVSVSPGFEVCIYLDIPDDDIPCIKHDAWVSKYAFVTSGRSLGRLLHH